MIEELIVMIKKIKEKLTDDSDMLWTSYDSAKELREELEKYLTELKAGKTGCIDNLNRLFLPTSTFQEHSLTNGWADEYLAMADEFDRIYAAMKK